MTMNAGQLRKALENVPDETPVVMEGGSDHSYLLVFGASMGFAERDRGGRRTGRFDEYFDDANMAGGTKVEVFILE